MIESGAVLIPELCPATVGAKDAKLGKAWTEPGKEIRGLRPNLDFHLSVTFRDGEGKTSRPSSPHPINLKDRASSRRLLHHENVNVRAHDAMPVGAADF